MATADRLSSTDSVPPFPSSVKFSITNKETFFMEDLTQLPNIGAVLADKLANASITSYKDLASLGSVKALLKIRASIDPAACYNMLYAIEGAIRRVRWHAIPKEERQQLKDEFDRAVRS
jgi:DNA transformation protein and related proteins